MSVNEINKKVQAKIHELEIYRDKFVAEKEQIESVGSSDKVGRHIQLKSYITRLEHEIKFLNEVSVDLEACESEQTINGEEEESTEEYSEDMGDVDGYEDDMGEEDGEEEGTY
jgi:hypothetical protein